MKTTTRKSCVICTSADMEELAVFQNFPIYMGAKKGQEEIRADQRWNICKDCGCIQLGELLPLDVVYKIPHNPAIGPTWESHNERFSKFIARNSGDNIMEIGGGNLRIAKKVLSQKSCKYSIYDKHCYNSDTKGIRMKNKFLDPKNYSDTQKYDTIISSHLVEHMYSPLEYARLFKRILPVGGRVLHSFPNITKMIEDKFTNGLNFEHTYQIDTNYLVRLMASQGFELVDKEEFNDYNPMLAFEKSSSPTAVSQDNSYKENKSKFLDFISYHKTNAEKLNKEIVGHSNAYLFGCHVFSQYLLEFGVDSKLLSGIIDNDASKQGDTLYGTGLTTYPSSVIQDLTNVAVVVQAGIYTKEVVNKLLKYNKDCKIIL